jgi:hypothetical protein
MNALASNFETRTRASGQSYYTLKEGAPEWLHAAIRDAHQGDLPNDWIWATCLAACEAIDEKLLSEEDDAHEFADGQVEIYTKALYQWAADMVGTSTYSEAEAQEREMGARSDTIEERFRAIQYFAIETIAQIILAACERNMEDA